MPLLPLVGRTHAHSIGGCLDIYTDVTQCYVQYEAVVLTVPPVSAKMAELTATAEADHPAEQHQQHS
jgi:hypothetical protein